MSELHLYPTERVGSTGAGRSRSQTVFEYSSARGDREKVGSALAYLRGSGAVAKGKCFDTVKMWPLRQFPKQDSKAPSSSGKGADRER